MISTVPSIKPSSSRTTVRFWIALHFQPFFLLSCHTHDSRTRLICQDRLGTDRHFAENAPVGEQGQCSICPPIGVRVGGDGAPAQSSTLCSLSLLLARACLGKRMICFQKEKKRVHKKAFLVCGRRTSQATRRAPRAARGHSALRSRGRTPGPSGDCVPTKTQPLQFNNGRLPRQARDKRRNGRFAKTGSGQTFMENYWQPEGMGA
jgi:hypothetical protein